MLGDVHDGLQVCRLLDTPVIDVVFPDGRLDPSEILREILDALVSVCVLAEELLHCRTHQSCDVATRGTSHLTPAGGGGSCLQNAR